MGTHHRLHRLGLLLCSVGALTLPGCGGGDDTAAPPAPATTDLTTTVIDGAIRNALVCLDLNDNGICDSPAEPSGRTDAAGKVTLTVLQSDAGKHAIIAVVGTDAVDADSGPVTTAYTLSAPADQTAVVSPLTTLVQRSIVSSGASTSEANQSVQTAAGLSTSPLADYTKATAPTDGTVAPATLARLVVLTIQAQTSAVASAIGSNAIDGKPITATDANNAVLAQTLTLLPELATAAADPTVLAATTATAREAALTTQAQQVATSAGVTASSLPTAVATVNNVDKSAYVATGGHTLRALSYTNASNYTLREFGSTLAQDTPDASNNTRNVEHRRRVVAGAVAAWGAGSDPWRNADLHWNGSAWTACAPNHENLSSVRDAQGNGTYDYCDKVETGRSNRSVFDIAGRTMADVYAQIRAAGYTNITLADPGVLGTATFPAGSQLRYFTNVPTAEALAYYPGGAQSPAGFGNAVAQYSAAVTAGGDGATQPAGTACNALETTTTRGTTTTTLETMIAKASGTPCTFGTGTFVYAGVTYTSDTPNAWWGNSTVSIGQIGSAPTNSGAAPGYYTSNTLLRVAFTGTGPNAVTYYACKQRFSDGSIRNCTAVGTGTYAIAQLGDGRALTFTNPPALFGSLTYSRVFVERGGAIYFGYQSKPSATLSARFNQTGTVALLAQLGITSDSPDQPLALTAGSYTGTWDLRGASDPIAANVGTTLFLNADGTSSCNNKATNTGFTCAVTINDPATGAYTLTEATGTSTGTFDFLAGTATGTFHGTAPIVGGRR